MKKLSKFLCMALCLCVLFAGCTAPASSSQAGAVSVQSGAAKTNGASPANVTLRMSWWGNDTRHKAHLDLIAKYEEMNPHVKIEAEYGGMEGYRQKLTTQLTGKQEPDLFWVDPIWLADMANQGDFFVNLYDHKDIVDISTIDQKVLENYLVWNDVLVGLPTGLNTHVFIVDDRIADLGIDLEKQWTWEDFIEAGKKVNEANPDQYLLLTETKFMNMLIFKDYMNQLVGQSPLSNEYTINFTEEQLVQGLTLVHDIYFNKVAEPAQDGDLYLQQMTTNPKWQSGDIRGAICWSSTATAPQGFPDNVKAMPYPQIPGATNSGIVFQPMPPVCVSKNSANVEEALKFLNFYINSDEAAKIMAPTRPFAVTENGSQQALEQNVIRQPYQDAFELSKANAGVANTLPYYNSEVENAFLDMVQSVAFFIKTPEEAAKDGMAALEEILPRIKP